MGDGASAARNGVVLEKAGWGKRKLGKGRGLGIAAHRSFLTYVATVVEVEVNDQGDIRIPRVDTVVDAGLVVNPEVTKAQFEGAAVFGTSVARSGEITAKNGVTEQSNFDSYPVARINEAPYQTNVYLVDSDAPPAEWVSPGSRHSFRRSAMRSMLRRESGFANCRSHAPIWGSNRECVQTKSKNIKFRRIS